MGTIIGNLLRSIVGLFNKLGGEAKKAIALAVIIMNAVKSIVDSPITGSLFDYILEFVKKAIPGELDDVLIDKLHAKLHEILPKLMLNTTLLDEIANTTNPVEKEAKLNQFLLNAIAEIKFSTDESKQMFFDGASKQLALIIADGEITVAEILGFTKYVFDNLDKLKKKLLK